MGVTMTIPDTHFPAEHRDALAFLRAVKKKYRPDTVVHIGDVVDFHCASRFVKSSKNSGDDEMDQAIRKLAPLYDCFPDVKVCIGNHDKRIADRICEAGLPSRAVKGLAELLDSPAGWKWADEHVVYGNVYEHGSQYGGRDGHIKAAAANMANTVIGHIHSHAGIAFVSNRRHLIWGVNSGCLIDFHAYNFDYARKGSRPILGATVTIDKVPQFVPMNLNTSGRWAKGGL